MIKENNLTWWLLQENATNAGKPDTKQISVQMLEVRIKKATKVVNESSQENVEPVERLGTRRRSAGMTQTMQTSDQNGGKHAEMEARQVSVLRKEQSPREAREVNSSS